MRKINYKSDFDFILKLTDCLGEAVGWPDWDWEARLYTQNKANAYVASSRDGVCLNCFNDEGRIHVVVDSHRMGTGRLNVELRGALPNGIYPDGTQDEVWPQPLEIELVAGAGDCPTTAEVEAILPYIKGEKGDKMTYADLTEEDKKDLIKPIEEKIDKAITGKQDKLTPTEDLRITEDNIIGLTDAAKMRLFCDMFNAAAGDAGYARITDGEFDCELNKLKLTYEEAIDIYNACVGINAIGSDKADCFSPYPYRTALPIQRRGTTAAPNLFNDSQNLEVVSLFGKNNIPFIVNRWDGMFARCPKLHTVNGVIDVSKANIVGEFYDCQALKEIRIRGVVKSFSIQYSPLLSLASVDYMVTNAANTAPVAITVHPDVYAKLTDESNTEWHQVLLDAAEKNITFATI